MITHKIKNLTILVLFVLLLISGGLNIIQLNSAKQENLNRLLDNGRNQVKIAASEALAKSYADRAREVDSIRVLERDSAKVAQNASKREIEGYRKALTRLRPGIAPRIDSIPDLRDFVALQDSLIVGQDSLIMSLEFSCTTQIRSFEEIIRLNRAQINEQVSISNQLQTQLVSAQTQTRKEVRRKKFWRTVSVIGAGAIGVLLLKPN